MASAERDVAVLVSETASQPVTRAPAISKAQVRLGPRLPIFSMIRTTKKQSLSRLLVLAVALCDAGSTVAQQLDNLGRKGKIKMETKAVDVQTSEIKLTIENLDIKYQIAVKNNDAETMEAILADDFILITGKGMVFTKADLLAEARARRTIYERQEDSRRTVRVWGDTAIITALLWEKGTSEGKAFDKKLWFSDVYKLTPSGWKYVFAQASIPLPQEK